MKTFYNLQSESIKPFYNLQSESMKTFYNLQSESIKTFYNLQSESMCYTARTQNTMKYWNIVSLILIS